jgi:hypothetical protein
VIDKPRIVAIRSKPVEMISGAPSEFDALLLAPKESQIQGWKVDVCGLNPSLDTQTRIWDLLCFEKDEAVTNLFTTNTLPHQFATPTFPPVDGCEYWNDRMDTGFTDTGWGDDYYYETCSHQLPVMFEAMVDGEPVYAAGFTNWYGELPYHLRRSVSYSEAGIQLNHTATAKPGEEISLEVNIATDASYANFQWYIDAGELKETGITKAHSFTPANDEFLLPMTTSTNRLIIPDSYEGTLRIWVVIHEPWNHDFDMTWVQGSIEVTP